MTHHTITSTQALTFDDARLFYNHVVGKCDLRHNLVQLNAHAKRGIATLHIQSLPFPKLSSEFSPTPSPVTEPLGPYFSHTLTVGMRTSFIPYAGSFASSSRIIALERIPEKTEGTYPSLDDIMGIPIENLHVNIFRHNGVISSFSVIKTQKSPSNEYIILPYSIESRIAHIVPPILRQYPSNSQR